MGAHSALTRSVAADRVQRVISYLEKEGADQPHAAAWAILLRELFDGSAGRELPLKRWMDQYDGREVLTLQVKIRVGEGSPETDQIVGVWAPRARKVDTSRATYVTLDNSRRDYRGVTTFLASTNTYIGFESDGHGGLVLLAYAY